MEHEWEYRAKGIWAKILFYFHVILIRLIDADQIATVVNAVAITPRIQPNMKTEWKFNQTNKKNNNIHRCRGCAITFAFHLKLNEEKNIVTHVNVFTVKICAKEDRSTTAKN